MNERTTYYDAGLQPERTSLAWRRTVLSLAAGALVSARLLEAILGPSALIVGALLLVPCALSLFSLHRRHLAIVRSLTVPSSPGYRPSGLLQLLVTTSTAALGVIAFAFVVAS